MSVGLTWAVSLLLAFVALSLLARHPALSRLAILAALGVIGWAWWAGWPVAVWLSVVLVAVGLALGPARVVCFELEEGSRRREPRWSVVACWLMAAAVVVDGAWCAGQLMAPRRPLSVWEWVCVGIAVLVAIVVTRFSLGPRLIDFVVSPLAAAPSLTGQTEVTDWFVARMGTGRATRLVHCVTLAGDPAIWRVSWWRLGTLATAADHTIEYRTATGAAGLRFMTRLRVAGPLVGRAAARLPAARRPIGPVMRTAGLAAGLLAVPVALAAAALASGGVTELSLLLLLGAVVLLMGAAVVIGSIRLIRGRTASPVDRGAERDGLRTVALDEATASERTGPLA